MLRRTLGHRHPSAQRLAPHYRSLRPMHEWLASTRSALQQPSHHALVAPSLALEAFAVALKASDLSLPLSLSVGVDTSADTSMPSTVQVGARWPLA